MELRRPRGPFARLRMTDAGTQGTFAAEAPLVLGLTTRQALQQALDERSNGRLHLDPAEAK